MVRMFSPKYCQMEQGLKVASKAVARFVFQALHEWLFQSNGPGVHHAAYWVFMNGLLKGKLVKGILFELPEVSPLTPHSSLVHFLHKDLHNFFSLIKDSISVWKWLLDIISHIWTLLSEVLTQGLKIASWQIANVASDNLTHSIIQIPSGCPEFLLPTYLTYRAPLKIPINLSPLFPAPQSPIKMFPRGVNKIKLYFTLAAYLQCLTGKKTRIYDTQDNIYISKYIKQLNIKGVNIYIAACNE